MTERVWRYVSMHTAGLSTGQIAHELGVKKNTVIASLRNAGVLRRAPGRDIEDEVALWSIGRVNSCFRMKGDRPFDLLIEGKRVDVKSAQLSDNGRGTLRYCFAITHRQRTTVKKGMVDVYYLVMKDIPGRPIYAVPAEQVQVKRALSIPRTVNTGKYHLTFLGHLDAAEIN